MGDIYYYVLTNPLDYVNISICKNLFGDIIDIYYGSTRVASYKYDAYGNCTVENFPITGLVEYFYIGDVNPFRYRGYYWCEALQMYHLQTRWYDPTIGRFISPDSYEYLDPETFGGLNLYAYCLNNPIMYVDSSGCFPVIIETLLTLVDSSIELYKFGLKYSLDFFEKAPKLTISSAKELARKGGHIQSARQIIREQKNLINITRKSLDDITNFSKRMGRALLVADIAWSLGSNLMSGEDSWLSDTIVDAGISLSIYGLSLLPGGFFIALLATAATVYFEDEIEEIKDDFYDSWNKFWSFN